MEYNIFQDNKYFQINLLELHHLTIIQGTLLTKYSSKKVFILKRWVSPCEINQISETSTQIFNFVNTFSEER